MRANASRRILQLGKTSKSYRLLKTLNSIPSRKVNAFLFYYQDQR
jgi:hypothetical protein